MSKSRVEVSRSIGHMIKICEDFISNTGQTFWRTEVYPHVSTIFGQCEPRFRTTMSIFAFFLNFIYAQRQYFVMYCIIMQLCPLTHGLLTEEQCWNYTASSMLYHLLHPVMRTMLPLHLVVVYSSFVSWLNMQRIFHHTRYYTVLYIQTNTV